MNNKPKNLEEAYEFIKYATKNGENMVPRTFERFQRVYKEWSSALYKNDYWRDKMKGPLWSMLNIGHECYIKLVLDEDILWTSFFNFYEIFRKLTSHKFRKFVVQHSRFSISFILSIKSVKYDIYGGPEPPWFIESAERCHNRGIKEWKETALLYHKEVICCCTAIKLSLSAYDIVLPHNFYEKMTSIKLRVWI